MTQRDGIGIRLGPDGQSLLEEFMLIRFGYDITEHCEAPTPMVCLMDVRPEHHEHMVSEEHQQMCISCTLT